MASQFNSTPLPQGFSVYQPALGAQLQFFPALGSAELDDMMHAYIPGPASIKEKRASVSLDFLEHVQLTGQTFKFYPVYSLSPAAPSPVTSVSSSFNISPVNSTWDWSHASGSSSASSRSSTQSRKGSRASTSSTRYPTTDFSHLPGMKIMTKDGQDVTNSASRGSKTKEQRDHAHLMRIIKACDSCRRKKIRCDPSHKKRPAQQALSQPAAKPAKKARTAPQKPPTVRTPPVDDALSISASPFDFDPTFSFAGLDGLQTTAQPRDPWEEFVQYPPLDEDYDFFFDPEGYLSSQSSSSSSSAYLTTSHTPHTPTSNSLQESMAVPGLEQELQALEQLHTTSSPQLPFLGQSGSLNDYTDFNLFSPSSSFSEDERMVPISSTRVLSPSQSSRPESPTPFYSNSDGEVGVTGRSDLSSPVSSSETSIIAERHTALEWYDPGRSPGDWLTPDSNAGLTRRSTTTESPEDIYIECPPGEMSSLTVSYGSGVDSVTESVASPMTEISLRAASILAIADVMVLAMATILSVVVADPAPVFGLISLSICFRILSRYLVLLTTVKKANFTSFSRALGSKALSRYFTPPSTKATKANVASPHEASFSLALGSRTLSRYLTSPLTKVTEVGSSLVVSPRDHYAVTNSPTQEWKRPAHSSRDLLSKFRRGISRFYASGITCLCTAKVCKQHVGILKMT